MTKFVDFMKEIENEAAAEGPGAVSELDAFREHFQAARTGVTLQACDCTCHEDEEDERACSCCPDSGRWRDTCEGEALTYGGHVRCRNGICWERLAEEAWKNGDSDL